MNKSLVATAKTSLQAMQVDSKFERFDNPTSYTYVFPKFLLCPSLNLPGNCPQLHELLDFFFYMMGYEFHHDLKVLKKLFILNSTTLANHLKKIKDSVLQ